MESVLQFKVPAQTSAILTNGKFQVFLVLNSESGVSTHALQANGDWMQTILTACRWGRHQPLPDSRKCFSEAWVGIATYTTRQSRREQVTTVKPMMDSYSDYAMC
jgi:hypothetical protein